MNKSFPRPLRSLNTDEGGFTIAELIIVMIMVTLLTTLIFSFAINFWSSTATLLNDSDTLTTRLDAADTLRNDLNTASGLIDQNSIPDSHVMNQDPNAGAGYWLLIHAIPGSVPIGASGTTTPLIYYQAPSVDSSKNFIMNGEAEYQDNFILYLDGTTQELLLRSLANPAATGDTTVTSCPPSQASSTCPADKVIATDVSSVDLRYFSRSGNPVDYTSITDPLTGDYIGPDFPAAEVVELTVHLFHQSTLHGGTDTSNEVIVRVAIRNS